jgi:hypothetical protein
MINFGSKDQFSEMEGDWPLCLLIFIESPITGSDTYLLLISTKLSIDEYPAA